VNRTNNVKRQGINTFNESFLYTATIYVPHRQEHDTRKRPRDTFDVSGLKKLSKVEIICQDKCFYRKGNQIYKDKHAYLLTKDNSYRAISKNQYLPFRNGRYTKSLLFVQLTIGKTASIGGLADMPVYLKAVLPAAG
jgi:hypothetical protein